MSRFLLVVLVSLLIIPHPTAAQTIIPYDDGCSEPVEIESARFDYGAACAVYRSCDPHSMGDFRCQLRAAEVLLRQCPAGDSVCEKLALLYAAAILAYDMPFGEALDYSPPQTIIDNLPRALVAAETGDYASALAAYQTTPYDITSGETMIPFSRGIIYDLMGNREAALAEYESIFDIVIEHPLAWYARSQLFGTLGRTDEASFDAAALLEDSRQTPELSALTTALAERYPLQVEEWLRYPVLSEGLGPAGQFFTDLTLEPPESIQIGFFDDLDVLVAVGLSNIASWQENSLRAVQVLERTERDSYQLFYPEIFESSGHITVTRYPEAIMSRESVSYFEGAGEWQFMLAPAGAPDPRVGLDGARHCPGSVLSRVNIGVAVVTNTFSEGTLMHHDAPGGSEIGAGSRAAIIGGPECVGAVTWWQAQDDSGAIFWTPENIENQYALNPENTEHIEAFNCPQANPTRLFVGGSGRVIPGMGANNLRSSASLAGESIGLLNEGETFIVIAGPVCADELVWWQVNHQDGSGWTAEGEGGIYWLEPETSQ